MQYTPGQAFYNQLCAARARQDLAGLEALYHPNAVSLSPGTGQVTSGRGAILDGYKQAFQAAGAIVSRSVESLVEIEGAVCVEATVANRFYELETYDVFLLEAGRVKRHVGGQISHRVAGDQRSGQGFPQTQGGTFYHRFCVARDNLDFAQLSSLYHPDAVSVDSSSKEIRRGREGALSGYKQLAQVRGYMRVKAIEGFVESGEIISAEIALANKIGTALGGVTYDTLRFEVLVLRSGMVGQRFSGLIAPRLAELMQTVGGQLQGHHDIIMDGLRGIGDSANYWFGYRRRWRR